MIGDITIGQYFPGKSIVHKTDPRAKLIITVVFIVALFLSSNFYGIGLSLVIAILLYLIAKIPLRLILKSLKPVLPIIIFTSIINMFFLEGEPILEFYFIKITYEGLFFALQMTLRILVLIAVSSLLTYTTTPIALTDGLERLLSPLKVIKVPAHELAMMMTIALRFIPTLIEETDKIISAQKARGADMESGGIMQRAKSLIPILIPLFISAFRRADDLAIAMECRCYRGGDNRTRMKVLKFRFYDFLALLLSAALVVFTVFLNRF